jgi:hypothetical protein
MLSVTMMGGHKEDAASTATSSSSSPMTTTEEIRESEALEELIREETKRHLEAAWNAQRRLAQACFVTTVREERSGQSKSNKALDH